MSESLTTSWRRNYTICPVHVQYMHTVNVDCLMGDPVFVIAGDNIENKDSDVQECRCLALGVGLGCTSWVTFTSTRC